MCAMTRHIGAAPESELRREMTSPLVSSPARAFRLERHQLASMDGARLKRWTEFLERHPSESPRHDARWLQDEFSDGDSNVFVYFLFDGDMLCGFAPFVERTWPVRWQLGEITLATLPLRRLCLLGGAAHFPDDASAFELLFREIASTEAQAGALYLENIPLESLIWRFVASSRVVRKSFVRYVPEVPSPRVLLRIHGSFDDYLRRFSSKHRRRLRRTVRRFRDLAPGESCCLRVTRPEEVDAFLERAMSISRKTYQWKLLGGGLRDGEKLRRHMCFLAENGWLRSYLLVSRDRACAFVVGYQFGSRYYLDEMGYDPAWRDHSAGAVLQLQVVEDLFAWNRPEMYDLGEYAAHKEELATETYPQGKLLLFRRGLYPSLVRTGHRGCAASTRAASSVLERVGLKRRLKQMIRQRSSR
jgi:hypothetical protein